MSAIAQVPILGHIVETIKVYCEVTLRVLRHPIKAIPEIANEDGHHIADAVKFLTAAVVLGSVPIAGIEFDASV